MKFSYLLFPALCSAIPAPQTPDSEPFVGYLPLTFTFHGGPATYTLDLIANGQSFNTNNAMGVSSIDTSTFDAYSKCNFYTTGRKQIVGSRLGSTVQIGPPQPIESVECQPTPNPPGTCLPVYASCEWCGGGFGGCYLLSCCSGYCAATKCRPTS
ncbi:hypothetical protein BJ875DRAFT_465609 [Amylocarpus encephaloides]|uniref:Uncharacterized protein n=1 Tax=Amylocarpus encephaloides TaxID=45428 RepID=A0A9P7YFC7_9HELO|nr:hypothetical protein BJ875DRAFT_465609 [Amylocarpus encephaloides]